MNFTNLPNQIVFRKKKQNPQWENTSDYKEGTFSEFLHYVDKNPERFAYCDYKHLIQHFQNVKELQNDISWKNFGFLEYSAQKSTIWIGSKDAHTPCHKDTYGCNLVAQIYGRKHWVLFPPEENLFPTRVPYEESSVFSKLNFYSPNVKKFKGLGKCKMVTLEPGDVLLVPHNWWHYVENLSTAISVNVWLEREEDVVKQLDESLIQFFIGRLFNDMNEAQRKKLMNAWIDVDKFVDQINLNQSLMIVNACKSNCAGRNKRFKGNNDVKDKRFNCEEILKKYGEFIKFIPELESKELEEFLQEQINRFPTVPKETEEEEYEEDTLSKLINAFTDDNVINLVKNNLLKSPN